MNINGLTGVGWLQRLESGVLSSIVAGGKFTPQPAGAAQSGSANSADSSVAATPSSRFSPDLLTALLSAQTAPPTTSSLAKTLVSTLDSNGDGALSLTEVNQAITGNAPGSSTSLANAAIADAFAKLDGDGDGQLSPDELAAAMNRLGGLLHHHHHHPAVAQPAPATQAASSVSPAAGEISGVSSAQAG